jgi:hypothetical protein
MDSPGSPGLAKQGRASPDAFLAMMVPEEIPVTGLASLDRRVLVLASPDLPELKDVPLDLPELKDVPLDFLELKGVPLEPQGLDLDSPVMVDEVQTSDPLPAPCFSKPSPTAKARAAGLATAEASIAEAVAALGEQPSARDAKMTALRRPTPAERWC